MKSYWLHMGLVARIVLFIIAISAGMVFLLVGARDALATNLKDISIVKSDILTLGDIFDDLNHNADYVLGPAPEPGKDMVLGARTLQRIAIAMDLPWRPSNTDQIILRRAATVIDYGSIETALKESLKGEGVKGSFNIHLNNGQPNLVLAYGKLPELEVSAIKYDPKRDWFEATVVSPSAANPEKQMTVMGQVERLASIPVLRSTLRNGDIIGKADIEWIEVREKSLKSDLVMDMSGIDGMTPRRIIFPGKPIHAFDLESPKIVERGDTITIVYSEGPLLLTAKGRALQTGAKGDYIRVANMNSSRAMEGFITAQREVTVK